MYFVQFKKVVSLFKSKDKFNLKIIFLLKIPISNEGKNNTTSKKDYLKK